MKVYNCKFRQSKLIYYIKFLTTERCFHHGILYRAGTGQPAAACPAFWKTFSMEFATLKYFIQKNSKGFVISGLSKHFLPKVLMCVIRAAKLYTAYRMSCWSL